MAIRQVLYAQNPILNKVAEPVSEFNEQLKSLTDDMFDTMYHFEGVGLAANQIGVKQRIVVIHIPKEIIIEDQIEEGILDPDKDQAQMDLIQDFKDVLINPEVISESEDLYIYNEGCLSVPKQKTDISRPRYIDVKYQNLSGDVVELKNVYGLLAVCIQHEIDHLNGVLFIDLVSKSKKDLMIRRMKKVLKNDKK